MLSIDGSLRRPERKDYNLPICIASAIFVIQSACMSNVSVPSPADTVRLEEHIVRRIRSSLPGVQGVYLFGSRATGHARPDSDYDVAVLCAAPVTDSDAFFHLQIELAALTEAGVNLADLRVLPVVMQFEVLRGRRRLFCADRAFCAGFEAEILSAYQRFEEERRPVITAFLNRRIA